MIPVFAAVNPPKYASRLASFLREESARGIAWMRNHYAFYIERQSAILKNYHPLFISCESLE